MTAMHPLYIQLQNMLSQMQTNIVPPQFHNALNSKKWNVQTDSVLKPGAIAPNFTLLSSGGNEVHLSDLLKNGPVVISFYRGGWCPYCSFELKALQEELKNINELGAQLIAVSPEMSCWSSESRWKSEVSFQVLTDPENVVAKDFGVYFEVNKLIRDQFKSWFQCDLERWSEQNSGWGLPYPGTFIVDKSGVIRYSWINGDISKRVDPEEILRSLKEIVGSNTTI